jgi:D-serine deaminase-like pyridoxal phosphate-dependent protein
VTSVKAVAFTGIHAYDGHIYTTDLEQRTKETLACFYLLKGVINKIEAEGNIKVLVVAGGTPTFPIYAKIDGIECSPGTFVFSDYGYQQRFPDMPFKPAAIIATRVMSLINENTVCLDLGHKSIAAENILNERIRFLNAPEVEFIGHSEEHLVIRCEQKNCFKIGDVLYGLPVHICPSCALYDYANIIVENNIVDEWAIIARKRKINI